MTQVYANTTDDDEAHDLRSRITVLFCQVCQKVTDRFVRDDPNDMAVTFIVEPDAVVGRCYECHVSGKGKL